MVARVLSESIHEDLLESLIDKDLEGSIKLYRLVRWKLNDKARSLFRSLLSKVILRKTSNSVGRSSRITKGRIYGDYELGDDFELELTIDRILSRGKPVDYLNYEDIVAIKRRSYKRSLVIILDASGSMSGSKIMRAATAAAVASFYVDERKLSVIGFNNTAFLIKGAKEKKRINDIIGEILDLIPLGYTNMYDALKLAIEEGRILSNPSYVLLTDGEYNVGGDPISLAKKIKLNVIYLTGSRKRGSKICKSLAEVGGGRYFEIRDVKSIPQVLSELLSM